MEGGVLQQVNAVTFVGNWDVMILSDGEDHGLNMQLGTLDGVTEVMWLYHENPTTLKQQEKLERLFLGTPQFPLIPFHHSLDYYDRYLNKVEKLWGGGTENYASSLTELDSALRAEQMESDVCDILWLLAGYIGTDNYILFSKAITGLEKLKKYFNSDMQGVIQGGWDKLITALEQKSEVSSQYREFKNILIQCLAGRSFVQNVTPPA